MPGWSSANAARARATPAASGEIPGGMKPWHGGDSAPADFDPTKPVMYPGGDLALEADNGGSPFYWNHSFDARGFPDAGNIIAYTPITTPKASAETAIPQAEIDRLRKVMADATSGPWRMDHGVINAHIHQVDGLHWLASCVIGHDSWHSPAQSRGVKDATLIVEAVNALPRLLAALSAAPSAPATDGAGEKGWRYGYPDGVPGTPEYEPPARICNVCNTVLSRCSCVVLSDKSGRQA